MGFPDKNGKLYVVALCEGNHCSEKKKDDVGNGRVVLMEKVVTYDGGNDMNNESCIWKTVRIAPIPRSAGFLDYSALVARYNKRRKGSNSLPRRKRCVAWICFRNIRWNH